MNVISASSLLGLTSVVCPVYAVKLFLLT